MQSFKPSAIELANLLPGELEYLNYGCSACHKFGREFNGPDLAMIELRRDDKWLEEWILDPDSKMKDTDIEAMRQHYKLAMPNQNVSKEDAKLVRSKAEDVKRMPRLGVSASTTKEELSEKAMDTIRGLDDFFWEELPRTSFRQLLEELKPLGGNRKFEALEDLLLEGGLQR